MISGGGIPSLSKWKHTIPYIIHFLRPVNQITQYIPQGSVCCIFFLMIIIQESVTPSPQGVLVDLCPRECFPYKIILSWKREQNRNLINAKKIH